MVSSTCFDDSLLIRRMTLVSRVSTTRTALQDCILVSRCLPIRFEVISAAPRSVPPAAYLVALFLGRNWCPIGDTACIRWSGSNRLLLDVCLRASRTVFCGRSRYRTSSSPHACHQAEHGHESTDCESSGGVSPRRNGRRFGIGNPNGRSRFRGAQRTQASSFRVSRFLTHRGSGKTDGGAGGGTTSSRSSRPTQPPVGMVSPWTSISSSPTSSS